VFLVVLDLIANLVRKSISGYVRIVERKLIWTFPSTVSSNLYWFCLFLCGLFSDVVGSSTSRDTINRKLWGSYHDLCQLVRLFLFSFNRNWNVLINRRTTHWYKVLWKS
jgi:hypothetical protein